MASASTFVLCASALFVQSIYAVCLRGPAARPLCAAPAYPNPTAPCNAAGYNNIISAQTASATGGGLSVTSSSALAPGPISVLSENEFSGELGASGNLPVLAAVALDGSVDTSGTAGTTYSCGSGQVGITAQSIAAAGLSVPGTGIGKACSAAPAAIAPAASVNAIPANACAASAAAAKILPAPAAINPCGAYRPPALLSPIAPLGC